MNSIDGYKSFYSGLETHFGTKLKAGHIYIYEDTIKYHKSGYHMCKRLEDTLRYVDGFTDNFEICQVIGSGIIDEGSDEYYGYYDQYAVSELNIIKILSREEIINLMINPKDVNEMRMQRFIASYKLTDEEISLIQEAYPDDLIERTIDYYQRGDKDAFVRKR